MDNFSKYIGLDTHKDSIAVAIAQAGRSKPVYYGEIPNTPDALSKLVKRLNPAGEVLTFCYEAGPCGYGLSRLFVNGYVSTIRPLGGESAR
jgi:hypothetical protein